jgi:hexokinase
MNWNKGFEVKGTLGNDVVAMMRDAFAKRNLNIKIVAIVNDTVGTLVAHCYQDGETMVGVILGTGTNAAYVESMDNIKKWESHYMKKDTPPNVRFFDDNEPKRMVINIEWGNFDNEGVVLPISKYDRMLDAASENPGA